MLRVTTQSLSTQVIDELQRAYQRVAQAQEQVTTGRRINRPSDDPIGSVRVLGLRSFEAALSQFKRNIDNTQPLLEQADSVLSDVTDGLNRVKEIALSMANDTTTTVDRRAAAAEVHQILQQLLSDANTKVENSFLFGGFLNGTAPFVQGANRVNYVGDNGQISIQTSPTGSLTINLLGNQVFQGAGVTGGVGIFDAVQDLENVLNGNSAANALSIAVNLDAGSSAGTGFTFTDGVGTEATAANFTGEADFSAPVTVFDSQGQAHDLTFLFAKTGATTFKYRVVANSSDITGGTAGDLYQIAPEGTLQFNVDGTLDAAGSTLRDITLTNLADGAPDITIAAANLSFNGSTQLSKPSAVLSLTQTNPNGIQAQLGRLAAAMDQISTFRAEIGARLNAAQTAGAATVILQDHTAARRSDIEDVDVLSAYSNFARLQQAFQAALQSAAQVIQPSLLDFLK